MQKTLTFFIAGLLASSVLAGCGKGRSPESSAPAVAPSQPQSSGGASLPAPSTGKQAAPGAKSEPQAPVHGDVDTREPAQRRDYQSSGSK